MLVKGFTAWLIINRLFRPKAGDTILIHGIAGGVGFALGQWSRHLGATVIGTVGSNRRPRSCASTPAITRCSIARPISSRP